MTEPENLSSAAALESHGATGPLDNAGAKIGAGNGSLGEPAIVV